MVALAPFLCSPGTSVCYFHGFFSLSNPYLLIPVKVWFSPQVISFILLTQQLSIFIPPADVGLMLCILIISDCLLDNSECPSHRYCQNQTHLLPSSLILDCKCWHHYFTLSPRYWPFHLPTHPINPQLLPISP